MRAAACYGASSVHCIGYVAPETELKKFSGSMNKLVPLFQHRNCHEFLEWKREHDPTGHLVTAELRDGSVDINRFRYPKDHTYIVVGNEMAGVPEELIINSSALVHIPMPGPGFCLNTSQTANVMAYEYIRQVMHNNG
jgi:tRNA(Leu) C34 or U34 (ribose-2'-O)-methylase TrmL